MKRLRTADGPCQGVLQQYMFPNWEDLHQRDLQGRRNLSRWLVYADWRRVPSISDHRKLQRFLWIAAREYGWDARTETQFYFGAPSSRSWCHVDLTLSRTDAWMEPQVAVELKVEIPNEWWFRRGVYQAARYRVASYGLQTFLVAGEIADGLDLAWASRLNVSVLTVEQFLCWMSRDERPALASTSAREERPPTLQVRRQVDGRPSTGR